MENNVLFIAIICFLIVGLSHLFQPLAWVNFFKLLIKQNSSGAFINGFITLPLGLLIVSFHNVWTGPATVLTVIGWCYILKASICFCLPEISLKSMKRVERNNIKEFRIAGVIFLALAAILAAPL